MMAAAASVAKPAPAPVPVAEAAPAPKPQVAEAAPPPPPAPEPKFVEAVAAPAPALEPQSAIAPASESPAPTLVATITAAAKEVTATAAHEVSSVVEAVMPKKAAAPVHHAKKRAAISRRPVGPGDAVMQIASYRTPEQVTAGWARLTQRYPALRGYLPLKARFDSANGTYWRLSIQGFANQREAINRCQQLKSNGGHCFVRGFAGDKPVTIASR
jgi:hypothetical protein